MIFSNKVCWDLNCEIYDSTLLVTGSGYYMYIEANSGPENDVAELISPAIPAGYNFCFTLHTNMYGDSMGNIKILMQVIKNTVS